jgi:hypothetical protein
MNVGIKKYKEPRQTIKVIDPLSFKDLNMKCPFLYYDFGGFVGAAAPDFCIMAPIALRATFILTLSAISNVTIESANPVILP